MYIDVTTGIIKLGYTQSVPTFSVAGQEWAYSFINLEGVEKFNQFTYSADGIVENRYFSPYYRLSLNGRNWSNWYYLDNEITTFPKLDPSVAINMDVKFVRDGSSTDNYLLLNCFEICGKLERNEANGTKPIKISNTYAVIKPPYIYKVFKITDIETIITGNTSATTIQYRYSQDYGRTISKWLPFTKENITTEPINPIRFFQIEYLITNLNTSPITVYDINLIGDFQNVSKSGQKLNVYGIRENLNSIILNLTCDEITKPDNTDFIEKSENRLPQTTKQQVANFFNPYDLDTGITLLNKFSNDVANIFGHKVVYFLTDPDKNGTDFTFHEYQLYNYICDKEIKVSVPENQFPDNQITTNIFDLTLFGDSFIVEITKDMFKDAFGIEKRPAKEDFLWFPEINKMFSVDHAQPYRSFNNASIYYKVVLKKYNQKANIIGNNQMLTDRLAELTNNSTINQLFGSENQQDKRSTANKEEFRPLTHDTLRITIACDIVEDPIRNAELIVANNYYDLSSGLFEDQQIPAIVYRNMKNYFKVSDNIGFMCWFNINTYVVNDVMNLFTYYDSANNLGLSVNITNNMVKVKLNANEYDLPLTNELTEGTWYAYVLNVNQREKYTEQNIYKRNVVNEWEAEMATSTKLLKVYNNTLSMTPVEFLLEEVNAYVDYSDMRLTNIRMYLDILPTAKPKLINNLLNQDSTGDDSKYLIFSDNCNKKISLPYLPTSQVSGNQLQ